MMHPDTVVRTVSPTIGNGVFATAFIPKGTLVVVRDDFDVALSRDEFAALPRPLQSAMETYSYLDKSGNLVLSWDHARYVNHNCHSNTLMTDYNVEVAVRDIREGEEITTDYGLLNVLEPYPIDCGCDGCRLHLSLDDLDRFADLWDVAIEESLRLVPTVAQPLESVLRPGDRQRLDDLLEGRQTYSSVRSLKFRT